MNTAQSSCDCYCQSWASSSSRLCHVRLYLASRVCWDVLKNPLIVINRVKIVILSAMILDSLLRHQRWFLKQDSRNAFGMKFTRFLAYITMLFLSFIIVVSVIMDNKYFNKFKIILLRSSKVVQRDHWGSFWP